MSTLNVMLALVPGPLYTSLETLGQLVDRAIDSETEYSADESNGIDADRLLGSGEGYPTEALIKVWTEFEAQCEIALAGFVLREEPNWSADTRVETVRAILADDGPLYILHSLNHEGTGMWDKEGYFVDFGEEAGEVAKRCHDFVCAFAGLAKFADLTGGGTINDACREAAYLEESDASE